MKKSNAMLQKAINEADTIRAGALKNAQDILLNAFQPHFKKMFNDVLSEQVGVHDQDPMDGPDNSYNQVGKESDLQNQEDDVNVHGKGPELLEQEEESDEDVIDEQEETDDEEMVDEQEEESDDDDFLEQIDVDMEDDELSEQEDDEIEIVDEQEEEDDDFLEEQSEEDEDFLEEQSEEDDELMDEQSEDEIEVDDDVIDEQEDDEIEIVDEQEEDEIELDEQDVNISKDPATITAANENKKLKARVKDLVKENTKLNKGISQLASKIKEINLFNAKVACANRILSQKNLSEKVQVSLLDTLDKCKTINEVKLAYSSFKNIAKSFKSSQSNFVRESRNINTLRHKPSFSKQNKTSVISEANKKMLRIAGISE
jgi:hypothetical protein